MRRRSRSAGVRARGVRSVLEHEGGRAALLLLAVGAGLAGPLPAAAEESDDTSNQASDDTTHDTSDDPPIFDGRVGLGWAARARSDTREGVAFDLAFLIRVPLESSRVDVLLAEVGYQGFFHEGASHHLVVVGAGVGWRPDSLLLLGVTPTVSAGQVVGGLAREMAAVGPGVSLSFELPLIAGVRVVYSMLGLLDARSDRIVHEARVVLSLHALPLVILAALSGH